MMVNQNQYQNDDMTIQIAVHNNRSHIISPSKVVPIQIDFVPHRPNVKEETRGGGRRSNCHGYSDGLFLQHAALS
jgi:hypothetical protein